MNELKIQNFLYPWLTDKKHTLITPNVRLYGQFESDLISVSRAGYVSEYEIKCSVSDFKKDFKTKASKHIRLEGGKKSTPNYFYFVVPEYMARVDVPQYSGLIIVDKLGFARLERQAKRLHGNKVSDRARAYLERGLMFRFWSHRLND